LNVIAEGVETQSQVDILRAQGCDEMQGFFFCKPLPAKQIEALLFDERTAA
jgi:EAL domain-containing protein (putative c-di-GMP-specific phosphodiesterase class I)